MSSAIDIDERYKQGKIYKLVDRSNGNIYIGSTIKTLNRRLSGHKDAYKLYLKGERNYVETSFEIIENNDFYIELIENYPCNNKYELETRERLHIQHNICVNKYIPTRTNKEYYEDNKDEIALKYQKNKEKIALKNKVKIICEICNIILLKCNITRHLKSQKHIINMNNLIN